MQNVNSTTPTNAFYVHYYHGSPRIPRFVGVALDLVSHGSLMNRPAAFTYNDIIYCENDYGSDWCDIVWKNVTCLLKPGSNKYAVNSPGKSLLKAFQFNKELL